MEYRVIANNVTLENICLHLSSEISAESTEKIVSSLQRCFRDLTTKQFQICVFIGSEVSFEPYFLSEVFKSIGAHNSFAFSDYSYVGNSRKKEVKDILLPNWSPVRHLGVDYLGPVVAVRSEELQLSQLSHDQVSRADLDYLILKSKLSGKKNKRIGYLAQSLQPGLPRDVDVLNTIVDLTSTQVKNDNDLTWPRVMHRVNAPNTISVVIPTRGSSGPDGVPLVIKCLQSLRNQKLDNRNLEIIVVYDTNVDISYLSNVQIECESNWNLKLIPYEKPFNFSDKCNEGAHNSTGEVVVFLNDDTEWIYEYGLLELAGCANLPSVGAAGAKLYFPDGRIQHGGFVIRNGGVGHAYFLEEDIVGPSGDLLVTHEVMGVTGACFAQRREVWIESGGWDPTLPGAYNDVDYCFRLRSSNFVILQVNMATLVHHESATRDPRIKPFELEAINRRWPGDLSEELYMKCAEQNPPRSRRDGSIVKAYLDYGFSIFKDTGFKGLIKASRNFVKKHL